MEVGGRKEELLQRLCDPKDQRKTETRKRKLLLPGLGLESTRATPSGKPKAQEKRLKRRKT